MADDNIRGRFLWHELMTPDPAGAAAFYGKIVGWSPQPYPDNPNYTVLNYGKSGMGGIMKHDAPRQWFCYIGTPNVDVTAREAVQFGGAVIKPADDIPKVGRFAILADPQGAMFYAFKPLPMPGGGPSPDAKPGLGDFHWHELMTTDADAAWKFYEKLFGWRKTDAMPMGPGQTYQMFAPAGVKDSVGGIFNKDKNMPGPAQWLPYAIVKDAKGAAKAIESAGGKVINGPMEVPGGDWITVGIDSQGTMFAVHSRTSAAPAAAKPAAAKPAAAKPAASKPKKSAAAKRAKPAAAKRAKPAKKAKAAKRAKPAKKKSARSAKKKKGARKKR